MSMAAAAATPGRLGPMVGRPSLQGPAFIVKSEYDKNDFRNTRPSVESTFRPSRMVRPPAPSAPPADGRFPAGKLPFAFEIDFVLNHPIADAVIAALVSVNCLIFPLQTIDVGPALHTAFLAYEHNLSILFLLEYFGRWYGKGLSPRFLLTRGMLVDFLAVAPFGFVVVDQSEALFVRILRLSRILRIQRVMMDTDRSAEMMGSLTNIQVQLANIGLSLFSLLYVSAGLFYTVEKDVNPTVLNFFDAFYFSTVTLFTVGFGDVTPLTSMGRTSKLPSFRSLIPATVRIRPLCEQLWAVLLTFVRCSYGVDGVVGRGACAVPTVRNRTGAQDDDAKQAGRGRQWRRWRC